MILKDLLPYLPKPVQQDFADLISTSALEEKMLKEVAQYLQGQRQKFTLEDTLFHNLTPFQHKVLKATANIPYGHTATYKDIALLIDSPQAMRAIGNALHHNPYPIIIPCHRIIGTQGKLTGYAGGLHLKQFLLTFEKNNLK